MKLHLGWFSQALSESHADLRKSKYYKSVEAVHMSACSLIGSLHYLASEEFGMVCRFGVFWSNTLSSAVSQDVSIAWTEKSTEGHRRDRSHCA